ncbi:MAG: MFS transporter, partial [Acidobacteriaceae bacterium]
MADVQTGLGPFLAAYLAASGWNPERLGVLLTVGGLMPIALQIPAGGLVDGARHKRGLLAAAITLIAAGALLLGWR